MTSRNLHVSIKQFQIQGGKQPSLRLLPTTLLLSDSLCFAETGPDLKPGMISPGITDMMPSLPLFHSLQNRSCDFAASTPDVKGSRK